MQKPITDEELKKKLTPDEYRVLREGGTESAYTGEYYKTKDKGMYQCKACGANLFSSNTKFDSGTGWPSFDEAIPGAIKYIEDTNHGMHRTEVQCANCNSHLGHVFDDLSTSSRQVARQDGKPAKRRYCINSVCLDLQKE